MQPTSSISDYIEFKDEIMKKIRLLENKFTSDFNSKFSQISEGFEKLDLKINSLSQNNTSLIEFITKQNFNYEKFTDLQDFKIKADRELITHDIKIKKIIEELEKLKIRYDKILNDNLIVPGQVGPGGQHKNLAEYVINQINEFQKIRNDTEQIRNRVDNAARIALNAVNTSFSQFQRYTDEKNKSTQIMIERKYNQFSDKILELETELNKYQYKIEKQIKPIEVDIQKLIKIRNNQAISNEQTFDNIHQKMNKMIEEFDLIKSTNKEYDSKIINYRQTNNTSELLNSKNTSKYNKSPIRYDNELFNNYSNNPYNKKKFNQKSQKNIVISYDFEQKNSSINQNELPKLNNDLGSPMRSNRNYIDYDRNIRHNSNNSLQEKKLISEKNIKKNDRNEEDITNVKYKKNEKAFSPKIGFKENDKIKKIESKHNAIKNNNDDTGRLNNKSIENEKFTKIGINKKIEKEKMKYIDEGADGDYITKINENSDTQKGNKKIVINGLFKDKKTGTTENLMNKIINDDVKGNNSMYIAKFDKSENNKMDAIQKDSNDDYDNNLDAENEKENNEISNNSNTLEIKNKNEYKKIAYKINNNNIKDNINFLSKTSKNSFLNKNEGNTTNEPLKIKKKYYNLEMNINEEQKQIMKKIRDYYQHKKIIMEKKLHENIVDCNVVNLNKKESFDIINIKYKNSSAKSSIFNTTKSLLNENRNNLKDISMKLSPFLRRTNYKFFDRRNRMNSNDYRSFDDNNF